MSSPVGLIIEMITLIIQNTVNTLITVISLFSQFLGSLGFASSFGPLPFIISVLILGAVLFFLGKFVAGSLKTIILLFIAGFVILLMVFSLA